MQRILAPQFIQQRSRFSIQTRVMLLGSLHWVNLKRGVRVIWQVLERSIMSLQQPGPILYIPLVRIGLSTSKLN